MIGSWNVWFIIKRVGEAFNRSGPRDDPNIGNSRQGFLNNYSNYGKENGGTGKENT